jgi:hypothetical protein
MGWALTTPTCFQDSTVGNDDEEARLAVALVGASTRTGKKRKVYLYTCGVLCLRFLSYSVLIGV